MYLIEVPSNPVEAYENKPDSVAACAILYNNIKKLYAMAVNQNTSDNYNNLRKLDKCGLYPIEWAIITGNKDATKILIRNNVLPDISRFNALTLSSIIKIWLHQELLKKKEYRSMFVVDQLKNILQNPNIDECLNTNYGKMMTECYKIAKLTLMF